MGQFSSILVYRGASQSTAPLKIAARIAASSSAHVTLADTVERISDAALRELPPDVNVQAMVAAKKLDALNRMAARVRRNSVNPSTVLLHGQPADAIVECVVRDKHDLILTNLPGADDTDADRKTTTQLIRQSPAPVMLVRELRRRRVLRIVAAVDSSDWDENDRQNLNERLVRSATWLAKHLQGEVQILHIWQPVGEGPMRWAGASSKEMIEYHDTGRVHVVGELEATARRMHIAADRVHVQIGDPRSLIPQFAADNGIDLIVLGTFARSGLSERILGNTANAILESSPCSMLIIPRARSS